MIKHLIEWLAPSQRICGMYFGWQSDSYIPWERYVAMASDLSDVERRVQHVMRTTPGIERFPL